MNSALQLRVTCRVEFIGSFEFRVGFTAPGLEFQWLQGGVAERAEDAEEGIGLFSYRLYCFDFTRLRVQMDTGMFSQGRRGRRERGGRDWVFQLPTLLLRLIRIIFLAG
jgi:hypothetical protein